MEGRPNPLKSHISNDETQATGRLSKLVMLPLGGLEWVLTRSPSCMSLISWSQAALAIG